LNLKKIAGYSLLSIVVAAVILFSSISFAFRHRKTASDIEGYLFETKNAIPLNSLTEKFEIKDTRTENEYLEAPYLTWLGPKESAVTCITKFYPSPFFNSKLLLVLDNSNNIIAFHLID
jgi:hypothetical protein